MEETKILTWENKKEAVRILKKGGIVAFPTDTVYGLAVISSRPEPYRNLVEVKRRSPNKPFTLMCGSLGMAAKYVEIDAPANSVLKKFFPGEVTALLRARKSTKQWVDLGTGVIGIRVPEDQNVRALIEEVGVPLLVPSANISANPPLTTFEEVKKEFDGKIDAIIKGECVKNIPSTIVDLTDGISLVREGPVAFEDIVSAHNDGRLNPLRIALGADHGGFKAKQAIRKHLLESGYEVMDFGTKTTKRCDYPIYGKAAAEAVSNKLADFGVLVCTSGEGISIAANKVNGIRCGIGYDDVATAKLREHNNANMVAFGQKYMALKDILKRVDIFLLENFSSEEKHHRRVSEIG